MEVSAAYDTQAEKGLAVRLSPEIRITADHPVRDKRISSDSDVPAGVAAARYQGMLERYNTYLVAIKWNLSRNDGWHTVNDDWDVAGLFCGAVSATRNSPYHLNGQIDTTRWTIVSGESQDRLIQGYKTHPESTHDWK
jgi:hypothetical protein